MVLDRSKALVRGFSFLKVPTILYTYIILLQVYVVGELGRSVEVFSADFLKDSSDAGWLTRWTLKIVRQIGSSA